MGYPKSMEACTVNLMPVRPLFACTCENGGMNGFCYYKSRLYNRFYFQTISECIMDMPNEKPTLQSEKMEN